MTKAGACWTIAAAAFAQRWKAISGETAIRVLLLRVLFGGSLMMQERRRVGGRFGLQFVTQAADFSRATRHSPRGAYHQLVRHVP
ncbi:MAG TPA: hypothetical protein VKG44_07775 [Candidatus Baltobacteraceae bacterium]|nr:hypothetical protein [Candidatus Baltobacteraceae bacterium]